MASLFLTRSSIELLAQRSRVKKAEPYQSESSFVVYKVAVRASRLLVE